MNPQIAKLYEIAKKPSRTIIGLMSGTSLDGLDVALCRFVGSGSTTDFELLNFTSIAYDRSFTKQILQIFAKRNIDQQLLSGLHAHIGNTHAELILNTLDAWGISSKNIDLIASHGQTIFHAPQSFTNDPTLPNSTLQIGDADHIAVRTGIITVGDFRQKHVASGGEGAPLVVYGDRLLFSSESESRILLNIGGISNFTLLPKRGDSRISFATDVGPGNTLMNQYMDRHFGLEMDTNANLARQGTASVELVNRLLDHPFLLQGFPKTTGPELFNLEYLNETIANMKKYDALSHADMMASLCLFSAKAISLAIEKNIGDNGGEFKIYVSGGGLHNPLLMDMLKKELPHLQILSFDVFGTNPDAKEACLFATLANETISGNPQHMGGITGSPAVCMGKISFPY